MIFGKADGFVGEDELFEVRVVVSLLGPDGVVFPPTYAATQDRTFEGGYNINRFEGGRNVCLIDSVGAQANRMEPIFKRPPYSKLVPQVIIKAGTREVHLLDAGRRGQGGSHGIRRCAGVRG